MASTTNRFILLFSPLLFCHFFLFSQQERFLVYLSDKPSSPDLFANPSDYLSVKAIERREKQTIPITIEDLPISKSYTSLLYQNGFQVIGKLKWLNAVIVEKKTESRSELTDFHFVTSWFRIQTSIPISRNAISARPHTASMAMSSSLVSYGLSANQLEMIGIDAMHNEGINGQGVLIAVLDAGFSNANTVDYLNPLVQENRIIATYDFVDQEENVFDNEVHGLQVLSIMAGYKEGELIGAAFKASYVLLRTEDEAAESTQEELNWAMAAEFADSIGADIITSSLGYSQFDGGIGNYTYSDMNGSTAICTKAADRAASKGMLVLSSAGNEGATPWRYILAPADGDSVLAIGAVDAQEKYVFFSSYGPSSDGRIKPDLVAKGATVRVGNNSGGYSFASGTSFACPLIAGLAAGIWQKFPQLTASELRLLLKKSGSTYARPNEYIGYGIPNYNSAKAFEENKAFFENEDIRLFPNPIFDGALSFVTGLANLSKPISIKVHDALGRLVAEDELTIYSYRIETSISTNVWLPGMYYISFYFSDKVQTKRLLKY